MKNGFFYNTGLVLMKISPLKICIIDDVKTYFNEQMLNVAAAKGNISFERYYKCDATLLNSLVSNPRDVLIIDIKGTPTPDIGKDGFDIAQHVFQNTSTYVVITSAHKYHLKNRENYGDFILTERLLTPIDFTKELNNIIENYLRQKLRIYQKVVYRLGKYLIRYGISS
jgi:hypothetical protein